MPSPREAALSLINLGQNTPTPTRNMPQVRAQLALALAILDLASAVRESKN